MLSFLLPSLLTACAVVVGSGNPAEESRDPGPFDSVATTTFVDVIVSAGDDVAVTVRCDDNLLDLVHTDVEDGELRISTPDGMAIDPRGACEADVTAVGLVGVSSSGSGDVIVDEAGALGSVELSGSGDAELSAIDTEDLEATLTGSGDLRLAGAAAFADLETTGSGDVVAFDLEAVDAELRSTGSGDLELTATGHVEAHVSGSGDIVLRGGADVDVDDSGSGDVVLD